MTNLDVIGAALFIVILWFDSRLTRLEAHLGLAKRPLLERIFPRWMTTLLGGILLLGLAWGAWRLNAVIESVPAASRTLFASAVQMLVALFLWACGLGLLAMVVGVGKRFVAVYQQRSSS